VDTADGSDDPLGDSVLFGRAERVNSLTVRGRPAKADEDSRYNARQRSILVPIRKLRHVRLASRWVRG